MASNELPQQQSYSRRSVIFFGNNTQKKAAETIQNEFIASYDIKQKSYEPRITLSSDDDIYFRSRIVEGRADAKPIDQRESNRLILEARAFFDERLLDLKQDQPKQWYSEIANISSFAEHNL